MKKLISAALLSLGLTATNAAELTFSGDICLKTPGGKVSTVALSDDGNGILTSNDSLPVSVSAYFAQTTPGVTRVKAELTAKSTVYFNIALKCTDTESEHKDCQFYLPGFWYHRNLRSPEHAPNFNLSDSWQVREDRLSTPLTGIYNETTGNYMTVIRLHGDDSSDCMVQNLSGDIILSGHTSIGYTGFADNEGKTSLTFGFPYREAPRRYIRKLTLIDPVRAFEKLDAGKTISLEWEIATGQAPDYSEFIADAWDYSFDTLNPQPVADVLQPADAKKALSKYFGTSYDSRFDLKYFNGVGLRTETCDPTGEFEIGFVGRVLLNAANAFEYGRETSSADIISKSKSILGSALEKGFTPNGFFREYVNQSRGTETDIYSIRRQSEGAAAILSYLESERKQGHKQVLWEANIKTLLNRLVELQKPDGSFPRKFKDDLTVVDPSGGSTPSATVPLVMGYKFFKDKRYLEAARKSAQYLENEIISKGDYFSSTLDANCEDKEAALYATTALYYLTYVTKGNERQHYLDLCKKAAYFGLSWYYLWDVPFAQGQMLGDVNFKTRGWGNVSVENNHIDVYVFEFATILDKLGKQYREHRFNNFANVIRTSMLQLMPTEDNMFDIAKAGFYPEVIQHTTWDYGRNGKGFYNDIFAPGWTVASLWTMLSPEQMDKFFAKK